MKRRDRKDNFRLNDKGSALIVCIIVLLFVSILATVILYMSGINYRMKKTDYNVKRSFYNGEVILERFQSNLIIPVSEAMDYAFRVANTDFVTQSDEAGRRGNFYNYTNDELRRILIEYYGESDSISDGSGSSPDTSVLIKNMIHNLTSTGPDSNDGIEIDHIYCNDGSIVTYQNYADGLSFFDAIVEANSSAFAGDAANPSNPVYYVIVYGELNQADPDKQLKNYEQFVDLDITNPDTGAMWGVSDAGKCRIVFKNVGVVCVQNGYTSIISTDVAVQFPPVDWDNGASTGESRWNIYQLMYYINWKNY